MASFQAWVQPGTRRWRRIQAGYQDLYQDSGNWSSGKVGQGQLIGTNMSVAAPTLIAWRGRMVSKAEMMALTKAEALQIYKLRYWDRIKGDSINSQAVANILADMKSSAGGNAIKVMQQVLNHLGEQLVVDGAFGSKTLAGLNRQILLAGEAAVFNRFHDGMIAYYKSLNSSFEQQWIGSLQEDYPKMRTTPQTLAIAAIIVTTVIIAVAAYLRINKTTKYQYT